MPLTSLCRPRCRWALLTLTGVLVGCSPALDWREVRPADSQARLLMPCKPSAQERRVTLAGQTVRLLLHACAAGGQTWGLAFADLGDPTRVAAAMAELGASAAGNIGAASSRSAPIQVPGATPSPASQRFLLRGARPDGQPLQMHLAVFTHGTRVFQASALGEQVPDEAAETFFNALRIQP